MGLKIPGDDLLSHTGFPCSTIGAIGLNFRVRDENGCFPYAIITGINFRKLTRNSILIPIIW